MVQWHYFLTNLCVYSYSPCCALITFFLFDYIFHIVSHQQVCSVFPLSCFLHAHRHFFSHKEHFFATWDCIFSFLLEENLLPYTKHFCTPYGQHFSIIDSILFLSLTQTAFSHQPSYRGWQQSVTVECWGAAWRLLPPHPRPTPRPTSRAPALPLSCSWSYMLDPSLTHHQVSKYSFPLFLFYLCVCVSQRNYIMKHPLPFFTSFSFCKASWFRNGQRFLKTLVIWF